MCRTKRRPFSREPRASAGCALARGSRRNELCLLHIPAVPSPVYPGRKKYDSFLRPETPCMLSGKPILVVTLLTVLALPGRRAAAADEPDPDEALLKRVNVSTDSPGLRAFLRERTL